VLLVGSGSIWDESALVESGNIGADLFESALRSD